jgi:hypothetical protein
MADPRPTFRVEVRLAKVADWPSAASNPTRAPQPVATQPTPAPLRATGQPSRLSESSPRGAPRRRTAVAVFFGSLVLVNLIGLPYYLLPLSERMRSPMHAWFKPSGYVGQAAGILAFLFLLFLWLYPLRKKYRWLAFTGSIPRWLDVHIVAGLSIPLLGAIHAGWRFNGLIGLGYGAILVVWMSGLVGRYLHSRIPRSKAGIELGIGEVSARRGALLTRIAHGTGLAAHVVEGVLAADPIPYTGLGPLRTMLRLVADDVARWRAVRALRRRCKGRRLHRAALSQVLRLARRQMALTQQARVLDATHQVFRYWHVAHRPVAVTALLAIVIHVVAVIALGVTWFR